MINNFIVGLNIFAFIYILKYAAFKEYYKKLNNFILVFKANCKFENRIKTAWLADKFHYWLNCVFCQTFWFMFILVFFGITDLVYCLPISVINMLVESNLRRSNKK